MAEKKLGVKGAEFVKRFNIATAAGAHIVGKKLSTEKKPRK